MAETKDLSQMLDALVNNKPDDAQVAFHTYFRDKMKEEIHGTQGDDSGDTDTDED